MRIRSRIVLVGLAMVSMLSCVPRLALGQEVRSDKTYDELLLEVAEEVPEFAGVLGGDSLKILVTAQRPGLMEEAKAALDETFGKFQFERYATLELIEVKYGWIQLMGWYGPMREKAWSLEGTVSSDIDEKENRLEFGVLDPEKTAEDIYAEAHRLGVPNDAVHVEKSEPVSLLGGSSERATRPSPRRDSFPWWIPAIIAILVPVLFIVRRRRRA